MTDFWFSSGKRSIGVPLLSACLQACQSRPESQTPKLFEKVKENHGEIRRRKELEHAQFVSKQESRGKNAAPMKKLTSYQ
jgi:type IV pilus biogenesis protein CpaD/CtpE